MKLSSERRTKQGELVSENGVRDVSCRQLGSNCNMNYLSPITRQCKRSLPRVAVPVRLTQYGAPAVFCLSKLTTWAIRCTDDVQPRKYDPAMNKPRLALMIVFGLALLASLVAAPGASAKSCSSNGLTASNGLAIVNVRAHRVSCGEARNVATKAVDGDDWYDGKWTTKASGRRYSCRITQEATGTDDPSLISRTKVRCSAKSDHIVRFWLSS